MSRPAYPIRKKKTAKPSDQHQFAQTDEFQEEYYLTLKSVFNTLDTNLDHKLTHLDIIKALYLLLDIPPSVSSKRYYRDEIDFDEFCQIIRNEITDTQQLKTFYLERRWALFGDSESTYLTDVPELSHEQPVETAEDVISPPNDASKPVTDASDTIQKDASMEDVQLRTKDEHDSKTVTVLKSLIAGGMAGACAKTVIAPFDRTKIIFQTSERRFSFRKALNMIYTIFKTQGVFGLWRGHSATLARVIPYAAIQFVSFDQYKAKMLVEGEDTLRPMARLLCGAAAGATSVCLTYPLDLIRARMAVQHTPLTAGGMRTTFFQIIKEDGPVSLFRGLTPTLIGILPYAGLAFFSFESLKIMTVQRHGTKDVTAGQRLACGACAGLIAQSLTYPLDIVRRRMQTDGFVEHAGSSTPGPVNTARQYHGVLQTMRAVAEREGIVGGLFKGVSMNWFKGPVAVGISFTTFDMMKKFFKVENYESKLHK